MLSDRHKRFCEEYLIDLNATAAYRRAGYRCSDEAARRNASRLLTNADIQTYVQQLQASRSERTAIDGDRVLQECARIAFADITQVLSFDEKGVTLKASQTLDEDVTAAIESIISADTPSGARFSVRMHSKIAALDMLAQHLGLKNDLNWAIATFRKYGYRVQQDGSNYQMIDTYNEGG